MNVRLCSQGPPPLPGSHHLCAASSSFWNWDQELWFSNIVINRHFHSSLISHYFINIKAIVR